jgi:proteasome alpha subunit
MRTGVREVDEATVEQAVTEIVRARTSRPDGPVAPMKRGIDMSMPFYVLPRADHQGQGRLRPKGHCKGPQRHRPCRYDGGILFVAENPSRAAAARSPRSLRPHRFRGGGQVQREFENLRVAGVRLADMRGYAYDRRDVTGRSLADAYAQTLGTIFTETPSPSEVEIVVAEVGKTLAEDQLYRLMFDGSVADEYTDTSPAMGGSAEAISGGLGRGLARGHRPRRGS